MSEQPEHIEFTENKVDEILDKVMEGLQGKERAMFSNPLIKELIRNATKNALVEVTRTTKKMMDEGKQYCPSCQAELPMHQAGCQIVANIMSNPKFDN